MLEHANGTSNYRRLLVLSYIKVAGKQYAPKNTFEAFFPFVLAAAAPQEGLIYEPYAIADRLRSSLGWNVGGDFVELFTTDLARRGLIGAEDAKGHRRWTSAAAAPPNQGSDDGLEHLKQSFFKFTEALSGLLMHNLSAEDRLFALANSLVSNRLFSIDALAEYAEREISQPEDSGNSNSAINDQDFDYVCARYISHCHTADERAFAALMSLANIGVVTQLANFFHHRDDGIERTGSPTIVLDGPFLLDYLGFNGETRRADAAIIVDAARNYGCKIWAFRHSVSEATDIVKAVARSEPFERYGPLALALRNRWVSIEELEAFLDDPFGIVNRMGVIDSIFDVDNRRNRWEEEDFNEEDWKAVYARLAGWKDLARRRDCQSILGIMRLRAGHSTRSPWDTKFFLLTSNAELATRAKEACVQRDLIDSIHVGPAISRNEFAAIIWLAGDAAGRNEVVAAHLLAAAQGMLARDKDLIERVREYTTTLSGGRRELVEAIVGTEISFELLQDITLGNPYRVDDRSFEQVINTLVEQGRAEGERDGRAEERRITKRLRAESEAAKSDAESARIAAEQAKKAAQEAELVRQLAEERAKIAESEREHAMRKTLEFEARAQKGTKMAAKAVDVLHAIVEGVERDWSGIAKRRRAAVQAALWGAYVFLATMAAYFTWLAKSSVGLSAIVILIACGGAYCLVKVFETERKRFVDHVHERWTRRSLIRPVRQFERRVRLPPNTIRTRIEAARVTIQDREQVLDAMSAHHASDDK